jgi:hypothetical protein
MGRPRYRDESSYLLVGFAKCSTCGWPVGTDLRRWFRSGYACLDSKRRGKAFCINRVALRQDLLDRAILGAIGGALDPVGLTGAVEKALERLATPDGSHRASCAGRAELAQVQKRLDRLVDALAEDCEIERSGDETDSWVKSG